MGGKSSKAKARGEGSLSSYYSFSNTLNNVNGDGERLTDDESKQIYSREQLAFQEEEEKRGYFSCFVLCLPSRKVRPLDKNYFKEIIRSVTTWFGNAKGKLKKNLILNNYWKNCNWAVPIIRAFSRFKSKVSEEVYHDEVNWIINAHLEGREHELPQRNKKKREKDKDNSEKVKFIELNKKNDKEEDEESHFEEEEEAELTKQIKSGIIDHRLLKSDADKNKVRKSFLSASLDQNLSNTLIINKFDEDLMSPQAKISINIYKAVTFQIESHLKDPDHPFCFIKKLFKEYYEATYSKELLDFKGSGNDMRILQETMNAAVLDLQEYARIMQETLMIYYGFDRMEVLQNNFSLLTKDNLINFMTSFILRDKIYSVLFEIQNILDRTHVEKFSKALEIFLKKEPNDFGVPDPFCLNKKTVNYFDMLLNKEEKKIIKSNNSSIMISPQRNNEIFLSLNEGTISDYSKDEDKQEEEFFDFEEEVKRKKTNLLAPGGERSASISSAYYSAHTQNKNIIGLEKKRSYMSLVSDKFEEPYIEAIKVLRQIEVRQSPINKLQAIVRTSEIINESIQNFYKKIKVDTKIALGGDEVLLIFIYLTAKSQIKNFYTHLKIIENFATNHIMNSISGYYFVTLQVCLGHLENLSEEAKSLDEDENLLTETITNCLSDIRKSFSIKSKAKSKRKIGARKVSKSFMT